MRISRVLALLGATMLWPGMLLSSPASAACTLNLGWEPYAPFQMEEGGVLSGVDVDLFMAAAQAAGCTATPKKVPWARLLEEIEAGKMDVAMGASISAERQAYANFSDAYRKDEFVLFVPTGKAVALGDEGLAGIIGKPFKLGTVRDYEYGEAFTTLMKNEAFAKAVDESADTQLNLRKLAKGRLDGLLENRFVALAKAKEEGITGKIEAHPRPVSSDDVYFMFGKKSVDPAVVAAVNDALRKMKADGREGQILAKYLN